MGDGPRERAFAEGSQKRRIRGGGERERWVRLG